MDDAPIATRLRRRTGSVATTVSSSSPATAPLATQPARKRAAQAVDSGTKPLSAKRKQVSKKNRKVIATPVKKKKLDVPDVEAIVVVKEIPMLDLTSDDGQIVQSFVARKSMS